VHRAVLVDGGEQRAHAAGARLEAGVAEERVEPDEAAARAPQAAGLAREELRRVALSRR
jgi:hypothetical protein